MQKLLFFLILGLLALNAPAFAQTRPSAKPKQARREIATRPDNSRQASVRTKTTNAGAPARPGARKAIPPPTRQEQPVRTSPPMINRPEQTSRRPEAPGDNRWASRDENRNWKDRDDRDDRDRRHRDWDRDDRHDCHSKGHGKGKGHHKKKGKGHRKHGCD